MEDPVTTRDGHSYDRRALLNFFQKHGEISPFSSEHFCQPCFYTNKKLGWEIRRWKESLRWQNNAAPPPRRSQIQSTGEDNGNQDEYDYYPCKEEVVSRRTGTSQQFLVAVLA
jgi:hypothetical protein